MPAVNLDWGQCRAILRLLNDSPEHRLIAAALLLENPERRFPEDDSRNHLRGGGPAG